MRKQNWPKALQERIKAAREVAFLWGENDCCLFVADCCVEICGVDPAEKYRGRYKTRRGAFGLVKRTHGSIEAAFDSYFGRIPREQAGRGDIALFTSPDGPCVGVLWGGSVWAMTESGVRVTDCEPEIFWRVDNVKGS